MGDENPIAKEPNQPYTANLSDHVKPVFAAAQSLSNKSLFGITQPVEVKTNFLTLFNIFQL